MFGIKNGKQYREQTSQKISWGHWFAFFNIILAIIFGSRYAFIIDWPHTFFGRSYFFISMLGHFSFIVFAAYLLLIFPLSFIIKNERTFRSVTVIIATIGSTLLLVDAEVFSRFNLHLSSVVWNLLVNPENGELSRDWQIFFAPMPFILLIQMLFSRWSWHKLRSLERQKWSRWVGVFFTCTFVATHLIYAWSDAFIYRPITMQKSNFPLSYPMTARTFLEKNGFLNKEEYENTLAQEGRVEAALIDYPKRTLTFAADSTRLNILVITVSGLRYDAVTADKMPQLNRFADNATRFMNHYSSGNDNNAGITGLFYGLNANYTDSLLNNKTPSVLMRKLQQEQYKFALFSATNFKENIFRQALFPNLQPAKVKGKDSNFANNQSAVRNWLDFIASDNGKRPWFSYLDLDLAQVMATKKFTDLDKEQTYYHERLVELDKLFGEVFAALEAQKVQDNTLIIVTAEHGYSFQLRKDDLYNYFAREQIQVPMIVSWKNLSVRKEPKLSSHVDVVPALMINVFNVENPVGDYSQGNDLFDTQGRAAEWVFAANHRWNVIITPDGTQYHIDRRGNYQKYDRTYQKISSARPPLGLFLDAFNQSRSFTQK